MSRKQEALCNYTGLLVINAKSSGTDATWGEVLKVKSGDFLAVKLDWSDLNIDSFVGLTGKWFSITHLILILELSRQFNQEIPYMHSFGKTFV